jgi:AAA domain
VASSRKRTPQRRTPQKLTWEEELLRRQESGEPDWLFDEEVELDPSQYPHLNPVSVTANWDGSATKPPMLVPGWLVRGYHHLFYGPKESGKTNIVLAACVRPLVERGQTVLWVDAEMDHDAIRRLLVSMGFDRESVDRHFVYLELPSLDGSKESQMEFKRLLERRRPALTVGDAHAGLLVGADLNENMSGDVLRLDAMYFEHARRQRGTTLMVDHTGHEAGGRARGASGKGAHVKVELEFKPHKSFDRNTLGSVEVVRRKNTLAADIPKQRFFEVGGQRGKFILRPARAKQHVDFSKAQAPKTIVKVIEFLKAHAGEELTKRDICDGAGISLATFNRNVHLAHIAGAKCVNEDAAKTETRRYVYEPSESHG